MRRHLTGIALAIVMVLAMFLAGAWGYVRLLRPPAAAGSPLSALPAQGGSLLSNGNMLAALGAVAGTSLLAGILIAAPRISALAPGLPGLFAIAWQALYLLHVHRAVEIIPLRAHAFGAGWEALLFNGVLGAAGVAMIIPLFLPSRWRSRGVRRKGLEADITEATGYMADLKEPMTSPGPARPRAGAAPAGAMPSGPVPMGPVPSGPVPMGRTRAAGGAAPTAANPIPGAVAPGRPPGTGLPGGPHRVSNSMRPRPYRRPDDDM
jgi:hypothetical protein